VIEKLRGLRLSRAAELVETAVEETLTYYAFREEHWRRIRTNNLREIRRRTRVVGAFPDAQSALNLAAAWQRPQCATRVPFAFKMEAAFRSMWHHWCAASRGRKA
jgi:transposase-like protein